MKKSVLFFIFLSVLSMSAVCIARVATAYTYGCMYCNQMVETAGSYPSTYGRCSKSRDSKHVWVLLFTRPVRVDDY